MPDRPQATVQPPRNVSPQWLPGGDLEGSGDPPTSEKPAPEKRHPPNGSRWDLEGSGWAPLEQD
jgi:hypothetical protein